MCGIVGISGRESAVSDVISGLRRLEYRGYDSAGIATLTAAGIERRRAAGKLDNLQAKLDKAPLDGTCAIGHSRWATHGKPTEQNAHPHQSTEWVVVHNGIIENHAELRTQLSKKGVEFFSETDSETVPHLLQHSAASNPLAAVQGLQGQLHGQFALGIMSTQTPGVLYATRRGAPLVIGKSEHGYHFASDPMALAEITNQFIYLEDDDVALLSATDCTIYDADGQPARRRWQTVDVSGVLAGKAGYRHFMLKEIHEHPVVARALLAAYWNREKDQPDLPKVPWDWADVPQITIAACGSAHIAGQLASYYFEQLAGMPVRVEVASELRYRQSILPTGGVMIAISQSGETADTLAALEYGKSQGQHLFTLTNTPTSSMARLSDAVLYLHAGPEIAVASTKALMAMSLSLLLLALQVAVARGRALEPELVAEIPKLPQLLAQQLTQFEQIQPLAQELAQAAGMFYVGRGVMVPMAVEGALKLKEISYIHAESYPAGEMKHGPIALLDEQFPVIMLACSTDGLLDKSLSNLQESVARGAPTVLVGDAAALSAVMNEADWGVEFPKVTGALAPLLAMVPLHILAYQVAVAKGTDVDQPRNLAKSVTVE